MPFERQFEINGQVPGELARELPGILSWVVRGATLWFTEGGLRPPEVITAATKEYRAEQDLLAAFLRECRDIDPKWEVKAKELYAVYRAWAEESGLRPWTQTRFGPGYLSKASRRGTQTRGTFGSAFGCAREPL